MKLFGREYTFDLKDGVVGSSAVVWTHLFGFKLSARRYVCMSSGYITSSRWVDALTGVDVDFSLNWRLNSLAQGQLDLSRMEKKFKTPLTA